MQHNLTEKRKEHALIQIELHRVLNKIININVNKSGDPDKVKGIVQKKCSRQFSPFFTTIFNMSMRGNVLPSMWKTSEIFPIPKKSNVTSTLISKDCLGFCVCVIVSVGCYQFVPKRCNLDKFCFRISILYFRG